jgi:hypothetical protein
MLFVPAELMRKLYELWFFVNEMLATFPEKMGIFIKFGQIPAKTVRKLIDTDDRISQRSKVKT